LNIEELDEATRNLLIGRAQRYAKGRLNEVKVDELRVRMEEEFDTTYTKQGFINILMSINTWMEDASDIFNTVSGLVSNFVLDGRLIQDVVTTNNKKEMRRQVIEAISSARKISVSYTAIEDKENILDGLKEAVKQEKTGKIDTPVVLDKEISSLNKLITVLNNLSEDKIEESKKITFDTLTMLERSLVNVSVMPEKARSQYYDYWENTQKEFYKFAEVAAPIKNLLENVFGIGQVNTEDLDDDPYSDNLKELMKKAYLPSYIINCSTIALEDDGDELMTARLVRDFLILIGIELDEQTKLGTKASAADMVAGTQRVDYDVESAKESPSFDPTIADDLVDEIEEEENRAKKIASIKQVDPLFSLLVKNNEISGEFSGEVISSAKTAIKGKLNYSNLGIFAKEMENLVDEQIDEFLDKFESSQSVSKKNNFKFSIPMMDSNDVVSHFDKVNATWDVEYYSNGILKDKSFNKYSEAVEFINQGTKDFFKQVGIMIQLQPGATPLLNKPRMPKFGTKRKTSSTQYQFLGGITKPLASKLPKASVEDMQKLQPLMDLIQEYYIKPLTGNMILLEDVPQFFTSPEFKDFPTILSGSNVNQSRKAMIQGANPVVEVQDFRALNTFLSRISKPDELVYSDSLKRLFENAIDSYTKFWANADAIIDNKTMTLPKIISDSEIVFGDSLYEIAMATESESDVEEIIFEGEPLPYWNTKQKETNASIESVLNLLESEEWITFIENSKIKGIKSENRKLVDKLKESDIKLTGPITHAMLQATDMLRKMQGKREYISNLDVSNMDDISYVIDLIEKEHNIDIYGIDVYNILKSQSSFNDIANQNNLSSDIVYKIKGLFR
tara:strand:+ start:89 stop:2626 length:2538 start_codon:yes stop_codon:yes gene_type:complete